MGRSTVLVIGAGALGKCLAALLADRADVMVYDKDPVIRRALARGCFILERNSCVQKVRIRLVASLAQLKGVEIDVLVFATKVRDLRQAMTSAKGLKARYIFLPQNGIFDFLFARRMFKGSRIIRGVTTMACQALGAGKVRLFYQGHVYTGGRGAASLTRLFRRWGLEAKACQDPDRAVWAKLIFSAVMNPLPVITRQGYGVLRTDTEVWGMVQDAVEEGRRIARRLKVRLAFDPLRLIKRVRQGDLSSIQHRGTLFQDMKAGRTTELDFITGALVRRARKAGVSTPALEQILHEAKTAGA